LEVCEQGAAKCLGANASRAECFPMIDRSCKRGGFVSENADGFHKQLTRKVTRSPDVSQSRYTLRTLADAACGLALHLDG
jgi:hypothetical protein